MEPMTLGSPSGSPSVSSSGYLPSFLMGDQQTTPRANTLSPTKGRSSLAFVQSPSAGGFGAQSPSDFGNRSTTAGLSHKFPMGGGPNLNQTGPLNHNTSVGPPTQGLFDSFRNEKQMFQTPTKPFSSNQQQQQQSRLAEATSPGGFNQQGTNDSYLNRSGFNVSRVMSPIPVAKEQDFISNMSVMSPLSQSHQGLSQTHTSGNDYWITVFGFPQSASSMILSHFSQCGAIIDKVFATQNGNWVHLRFSSRLECDKALNYNGKIIGQNLMLGVQYCNDPVVIGKENSDDRNQFSLSRVRSLTHIAYKNAQQTDVLPSPTAPKRSAGIVNKAMDLFFGW
ncbi:nucleoporin NUP53 [Culex quinquefasciatus]|uniref:Nucleoporin NUP53 n=1 Tax=Culex quinquefasciatus TaxID=7176 RepID=B0WQV6_CULQU|nr:nucleoporin NUP53 [Culex quinquefasciatus]|eukprot:XP_001851090.1 nucleoporin NUP53 [Culex quinquefasciatus]